MNLFVTSLILLVCGSLNTFAEVKPDFVNQARTLSSRLRNGVHYSLNDPKFKSMVELLSQGKPLEAADIAIAEKDFLESTVLQIAAPMLNLAGDSADNKMSDALALIIGTVKDDKYFGEILSTSAQYVIKGTKMVGGKVYSSTRFTYKDWDTNKADLRTELIRIDDGSDPIGYTLASEDRAGILSSDKWAFEFTNMGTNRRNIKGLFQLMGLTIDSVRSKGLNRDIAYIGRDVSRLSDPFQPDLFEEYCATCHYAIDAQRDAFFEVDYDDIKDATGKNIGMGIFRVMTGAKKYSINTDAYPGGHVSINKQWQITFTPEILTALGWDTSQMSGTGIKSLGLAYSKSKAFWIGMVNRVSAQVCPGIKIDLPSINTLATEFQLDGNFKKLIKKIATRPECLGV